jgi:hypothetical protein
MKYGLATCIAFLLGFVLVHPVSAAEPVGKVTSAKTAVFSSGSGGRKTLDEGDPVFFLDRLSTNGTGVGEFVFQDGTKLALGPSAGLVVDRFVLKNRTSFQKFGVKATKGTFRWISGRSPSSAYQISTPTGTMSSRGTAFDVTTRNGVTHIVLLNGAAKFCSGKECCTLKRSGDYIAAQKGKVCDKKDVRTAFKTRKQAAQVFPFLANPGMLSPSFRPAGSNLLRNASFGGGSGTGPAGNTNTGGTTTGGTTGGEGTQGTGMSGSMGHGQTGSNSNNPGSSVGVGGPKGNGNRNN